MEYSVFTIGLAMVATCVVAFALVLPRGGRVSPVLRSGGIESAFMMVLLLVLLVGGALALMGAPAGIVMSTQR
jgi:hypothetical protein